MSLLDLMSIIKTCNIDTSDSSLVINFSIININFNRKNFFIKIK